MPSSTSTILFLAALAVVGPVAMSQPANALQGMGPPPVRRAEHIEVAHKMIKKRSPRTPSVPIRRQDVVPNNPVTPQPIGGPSDAGTVSSASVTRSPTTGGNSAVPTTTEQTTTPTTSRAPTTRPTTTEASISSTTSSRSATTTSTPTTSSTSQQQTSLTSSTPTTTQDAATQPSSTTSTRPSTLVVTSISTASAAPQQSDKSKDEDASFLPKPVIVSLIVAASCVVGAAAIWTLIRKWKFGASRKFEDRLEPINWQPPATTGNPIDERDPTAVALARGNSITSHRTRTSSEGTHVGGAGGRNMATVGGQAVSVAPDFPPLHDFTAGPSHLAPGAGYTDLQRGPSPAPSMNYGGYGQQQFETPNPYDAYDYNGGYGGYGGVQPQQQPSYNNGPGPHQF